jgi:hypothetical protein
MLQEFMTSVGSARAAVTWLRRNLNLFRGTVTEPVIIRSDDAAVKESVRRQIAFGATYEGLRDDLLFNYEQICDVNLFVKIVRHARYPQWQGLHRREQ